MVTVGSSQSMIETGQSMPDMNDSSGGIEKIFLDELHKMHQPKVLELGTLQWTPGRSTHHQEWLPENSIHIKSDVAAGQDVDIVADAHDLAPFADNEFDAFIAVSVWEHLRKPWLAAAAVHRVLKPGGILYVATHQTFPIHGYPSDYYRWTDEGIKALFDEPEFTQQAAAHAFPCVIMPPSQVKVWNKAAPAYLNVAVFAKKA